MRTSIPRTILLGAFCVLAACNDTTAPPSRIQPEPTLEAARNSAQLVGVYVLRRKKPLDVPLTSSATIGFVGGRLAIPEAGLTVDIPVGALLFPTTISVTARAGDNVAYEFAPHGQIFFKRVIVSQTLSDTYSLNSKPQYRAAYYLDDPTSWQQAVINVIELLTTTYDRKGQTVSFGIVHFSGYLMSSGCADDLLLWQ
jgi:hypothetical protein